MTIQQFQEINCEQCNKLFQPKRAWSKFCSPECRTQNWIDKNPRVKEVKSTRKLEDKKYIKLNKALNKQGFQLISYIMTEQGTIILNVVEI